MVNQKQFSKDLKRVVKAYYKDGELQKTPNKKVIGNDLSEERNELLINIVKLMVMTNFTDKYTKLYLIDGDITYKKIAEDLMNDGEDVTESKIRGKIWYSIKRLKDLTDIRLFDHILFYSEYSVSYYNEVITAEIIKNTDSIYSEILLDIKSNKIVKTLDSQSFNDMIDIISPYTKAYVELISKSVTDEMAGYLNYLDLNKHLLPEEDLVRYKILKDLVK